ncbi:zinc-binding alcohol dehydrogenase family protein [Rhizobium ruizarguesonis]|jgi:NADPH2:quinone reductase|uniref:zinc-binding alcohol dehydrogenase family protein n=1 Tax=Rhizobium ruizarguesonis TaxID=2081791 RepID=UPI00094977BA|nr:zinc-binding alcohol dehydrogenase family protein [Rhizobium ruizarguesonis]MBY5896379.1 zinc-binding alcohol dehydrogenase family protein [Rhizobium leguminosarum]TCA41038.1 zinc-binding alcohol dehydrogenase family protein [Rhizobium leguminosarum bv. viciae]NEJ16439.1 zinc-binding alcohol dehydrogenase family protein [Rhizobium ruizarguesonis]NEK30440.1 zinc-binding alcohol dehydrogenase family protein [Rhizobium ruizarguesonis]NKQ84010.1 zinc-binding alcohol dehydrogenase family protein
MRAVAYKTPQPISAETSLIDVELPIPEAKGHDLLVEIKAVSVNPVDVKVRAHSAPPAGEFKVLGWDAAGIVKAIGADVTLFKPGDEVFYSGVISRPGSNAEFHLVDERIVGAKPKSLDFAAAAALPLTSITAYEALFDRLKVQDAVSGAGRSILIIGGAGGVGSITIQIARALTDLTVIATASRPETQDWVKELGAHHVVDHSKPIAPEVAALGIGAPGFIFSTTNTDSHIGDIVEAIAPQGRFALIDDPKTLDIVPFKRKAVSVHWELMFTRPLYGTPDMIEQHKLLNRVSELVDAGKIRTTLSEIVGPINAANLKTAHAMVESGRMKGKAVLAGF